MTMGETMSEVHVIGEGVFGWYRGERVSDRYGAVSLWAPDSTEEVDKPDLATDSIVGKSGKIRAVIIEARESGHIGDFFHGLGPNKPKEGDVIDLGIGEFFSERNYKEEVGVRPTHGNSVFWMNPNHLYRAHDSVVRLEFIEGDLEMDSWIQENEEEE